MAFKKTLGILTLATVVGLGSIGCGKKESKENKEETLSLVGRVHEGPNSLKFNEDGTYNLRVYVDLSQNSNKYLLSKFATDTNLYYILNLNVGKSIPNISDGDLIYFDINRDYFEETEDSLGNFKGLLPKRPSLDSKLDHIFFK